MITKISTDGVDRIVQREDLRLTSYLCQAGVWTIGIGHTSGVKPGMRITRDTAFAYLHQDLEPIYRELIATQEAGARMTQRQFDALASFIMPIGVTAYRSSTLRKRLIKNAPASEIAEQMRRWVYYTDRSGVKEKSQGLINRRESEVAQYQEKA